MGRPSIGRVTMPCQPRGSRRRSAVPAARAGLDSPPEATANIDAVAKEVANRETHFRQCRTAARPACGPTRLWHTPHGDPGFERQLESMNLRHLAFRQQLAALGFADRSQRVDTA